MEEHECFEIHCHYCRDYVDPNHECYHKPEPAKPHMDPSKFRFFDFECDVSGEYHIPNYAEVSVDGSTFVTYEANGDSIVDQFCEAEFCEANRGCCYVAHNAKGYDAQFISEYFRRKGVKFQATKKGNKLLELKIPALNIRIIDSLNFIPKPLSDFPKMFGLQESLRKGLYPHRFNTKENWDYVGPMPHIDYFLDSYGGAYVEGEELPKKDPDLDLEMFDAPPVKEDDNENCQLLNISTW